LRRALPGLLPPRPRLAVVEAREPGRLGRRAARVPRSLDVRLLDATARYLGLSPWTVRSWVETGTLRAITLPGLGKLIRLDVRDLDALVEASRD
jgi:excisionase family DNA binding protein